MKRAISKSALAALLLLCANAFPAHAGPRKAIRADLREEPREPHRDDKKNAQKARSFPRNPAPAPAPRNSSPANNESKPLNPANNPQTAGMPPAWLERLQDMSPTDQERFLNNNERFKNMTPEQKARVRENLQRWNQLTPAQRQEMRERQKVFASLTPQERQYVRDTLLPRWQNMPANRKRAVTEHLRQLQGLDDAQRQAKLNDPAFLEGLNPDEQEMLRSLSRLRVGAGEGPSGGF